MRVVSLFATLFIFWLLLSGFYYKPWLVGSGIVCTLLIIAILQRANMVDEESHPIERLFSGLVYWPWLLKEIVLSALTVTKIILDPKLPIAPKLVWIKASQKSALGLVTYANSITMTPGTISARVSSHDREIMVHAIADETAQGLFDGEMDRRVLRFEGDGK